MSWLRRGARVSWQTTPAHLVITKGAVTLEGVSAKFRKMRYLGGDLQKNGTFGPRNVAGRRPSVVARGHPFFFLIFFSLQVSESSTLVVPVRRWTGSGI